MQILRQAFMSTTNKCLWSCIANWKNDPTIMEDYQKVVSKIDNHVYKGHIQDAVDAGIFFAFHIIMLNFSFWTLGKMVKKSAQDTQQQQQQQQNN